MKLTFNYYHNLERVELWLCNPDGRELFPLPGKNRNLDLRFNDLSELTFDVDSKITLSDNKTINLEAYDYIRTKRLIYATNIGWFQISAVDEHDNGITKYKTIRAESYQSVFKNKGFISEERVYCFYNPNDPHDDRYESTREDSVPSVLGQWSKQLGIRQALEQGLSEPEVAYDNWTVTYVHPSLIYANGEGTCRTFKENTTFGYDWIVNDVEDAFEVVVLFDFMYKTIHIMTPEEAVQKANIIYTFSNFMKAIDVNEDAEDVVTVLNCNGDNCDITAVNPTGTNYICDFSYYMDKVNYRWMSAELIRKLEQWNEDCEAEKEEYSNLIQNLRSYYHQHTEFTTELKEMSLSLQDLKNAQAKRSVIGNGTAGNLCGIVLAENVQSGNLSIKSGTDYCSIPFSGDKTITAYQISPTYKNGKWEFSGASKTGTADSIIAHNFSDDNTSGLSYWYFSDVSDGSSYCKLQSEAIVDANSETSAYHCSGFSRYIAFCYPIVDNAGNTTYTDNVQEWIDLKEKLVNSHNAIINEFQAEIDKTSNQLEAISSRLNILSYFANTPSLLRELNCYWIEGDYTNEHIAVLEETPPEEEIDLSNELLAAGRIELSKVSQPRFSFTVESVDATKQYEFRSQMRELELGKIVTVEKEDGIWYYPALLGISINLDNSDDFTMQFANAIRLDDWGYTYADLISDASSTSRKVSANWQDFLSYSKERENISSIIRDPLDTTLRAAFANMVNQEFTVDKNGILGRKKTSENSEEFENEQVRLINNLLIFTDDNWETAKTALGKIYYKDSEGNLVTSYGLIAETIIGSLIMGEKLEIKNKNNTIAIGAEGIQIKRPDGGIVFSAGTDGSLIISGYASDSSLDEVRHYIKIQDGKIEAYAEAIAINAKEIAIKASVEELDKATGRITRAETLISQNTEAIELKASKATMDVMLEMVSEHTTSISQTSDAISLMAQQISSAEDKIAELEVAADGIDAKVSSTYGNSTSSFGWSLKTSGFYVYSNALTVLKITKSGLEVKGNIKADEGYLNNLTVTGKLTFDGGNGSYYINHSGTNNEKYLSLPGVTIDSDGIVLNKNLKSSGTITFEIPSGAFYITNSNSEGAERFMLSQSSVLISSASGGASHSIAVGASNEYKIALSSTKGKLAGTWHLDSDPLITSDINKKNTIEDVLDVYEPFYDNLRPVTYKYNDGTSGRKHLGFIAQEVKSALDIANISANDFAGFAIKDNLDGTQDWYLRYGEFVSLNTWQIQKLKARVSELENAIAKIQGGQQ